MNMFGQSVNDARLGKKQKVSGAKLLNTLLG